MAYSLIDLRHIVKHHPEQIINNQEEIADALGYLAQQIAKPKTKLTAQPSPVTPNTPIKSQESSDYPLSIRHLFQDYEQYELVLKDSHKDTFNIFTFTDIVGREKTLPLLSLHLIFQHNLHSLINERKFAKFLSQVYSIYRRDVQYHNDLHGVDVAQMANLIMTKGELIKIAQLNQRDILAFLIAGLCHDLGHDGYTNGFHANAMTERGIIYNDVSIQESYHVAQTFAIIKHEDANFLDKLTSEQFKQFRKRVIGTILATDMAKHNEDMQALKSLIESNGISKGKNAELAIKIGSDVELFESQQFLLEISLHSCDISQQTRPFEIAKNWSYLLFEEFFDQGDQEKQLQLPISFGCDRKTTNIPKSHPGFINMFTLPLWSLLIEVLPGLTDHYEQAKFNAIEWSKYEENEEDRKYYVCKKI